MRWTWIGGHRGEGRLRVLAPAKLNLYLEVGAKRQNGYHDIDSLFQAVSLYDELEFLKTDDGKVDLEEEGIFEVEKNIVYKAAVEFRERFLPPGSSLGVQIRLCKKIPQGAGLGGGSSDAAATLMALRMLWSTETNGCDLWPLATSLGADVPFFLVGGTARCRGRGERVESFAEVFDAQEPFHYVLAWPRINVSTKEAYEALDASRDASFALTLPSRLDSMLPVEICNQLRGGQLFFNRFEEVVSGIFPQLGALHEALSRRGFVRVLMSGSGSTMYGCCRSADEVASVSADLRKDLDADIFAVSSERSHGGLQG